MSTLQPQVPDAQQLAIRIARRLAAREQVTARRSEWQERAAVLAWFRPRMIGGPEGGKDRLSDEEWLLFLGDTEPVPRLQGARRLREAVRRTVLERIGPSGWRSARVRIVEAPDDPLQSVLDMALSGKRLNPDALDREQLDALHVVCRWLNGVVSGVPDVATITVWGLRSDLLAPLRRMTKTFIGRETELDTLRAYLGAELPSSALSKVFAYVGNAIEDILGPKTLALYGPGGVGKSTLVARVMLEYAERDLPFVYIDLDRPSIDPRNPFALLAEAQRQLELHDPSPTALGASLAADLHQATLARATTEASRGTHSVHDAVVHFVQLANQLVPQGRRLPFVLDTFEEAQALGDDALPGIASLVRELRIGSKQVRPLICGRVAPDDDLFDSRAVRVPAFEHAQAAAFLQEYLTRHHHKSYEISQLQPIVEALTGTPLALALAAQVIAEQGLQGVPRPSLMARLLHLTDEAQLYSRVLGHIHDPQLRALAKPGLLVRRLTPEVVVEVLAEPCGLAIRDVVQASELLERFAGAVSLVEREPDGALRHRQDVRQQMLKSLERDVGSDVVEAINRRAVDFYAALAPSDPISRAEHIYHLLRVGDVRVAAALWVGESTATHAALERLRSATDELRPDAARALKLRLGMRLTNEERRAADQDEWEQAAFRAASAYLADGDFGSAMKILSERSERLPDSHLPLLEVEALSGMHRWEDALRIAVEGAEHARARGDSQRALSFLLSAARASEATHGIGATLHFLAEADAEAQRAGDIESLLRIAAARLRIGREGIAANERVTASEVRDLLKASGVLDRLTGSALREVAASFGDLEPALIRAVLFRLGVPELRPELVTQLAAMLAEQVREDDGAASLVLATCAQYNEGKLPDAFDTTGWQKWLLEMPRQRLGYALADLIGTSGALSPLLVAWVQAALKQRVEDEVQARPRQTPAYTGSFTPGSWP